MQTWAHGVIISVQSARVSRAVLLHLTGLCPCSGVIKMRFRKGRWLRVKTDKRLSAENFMKLVEVFTVNKWEIPNEGAGMESRFNRFCERLCTLDAEEQRLVIELTRRFTAIGGAEYPQLILKLMNCLHSQNLPVFSEVEKVFILPLIAPEDHGRTKSSSVVWYHCREELIRYSPLLADKNVLYYDIKEASQIKNLKTNELVILVDDFVGSGETTVSAVNWLTDSFGADPKQIVILSIAALEMGIDHVRQEIGVEIYAYYIFQKGISDYYSDDQRAGCLKTMKSIENKLKVSSKFRLGYAKSEALISLIRTPNNTFPVFWKSKDLPSPAPFSRG